MSTVTATEAKNKFGQMLEMARKEPVRVQKNGRDVAVILSPEEFQALAGTGASDQVNPAVKKLHAANVKRFGKVFEALAK